jgi:integrase
MPGYFYAQNLKKDGKMASKYRYILNYTDPGGIRRQKSFYGKTKRIASERAKRFLQELNEPKVERVITFRDWAAEWLELYPANGGLSTASMNGYELAISHLNDFFGSMPIQSIKPTHVRKFFARFKKPDGTPYSSSMLLKVRNTFSAIMEAACDNGHIFHNPVRSYRVTGGEQPKQKRAYTIEQARIFSEFAKQHPHGLGAYILLHTGLRPSEMMGIKPATDFDFSQGTLTLHRTITDADGYPEVKTAGKTATALRTILLDPDALFYLNGRMNRHKGTFLFPPHSNRSRRDFMGPRAWTRGPWKKFIADFSDAYPSIPALLPGELRHTWFTLMREVNPDRRVVDLQGGHSLKGLTDSNYSHYTTEWLKENTIFPDYEFFAIQKSNVKVT